MSSHSRLWKLLNHCSQRVILEYNLRSFKYRNIDLMFAYFRQHHGIYFHGTLTAENLDLLKFICGIQHDHVFLGW